MRLAMSSSPLPLPFSTSSVAQARQRNCSAAASPLQQQSTSPGTHEVDQNSPEKPKTIRFRLSELCRQGQLHLARQLFDAIPQPTTVLWNTLIIGYICNSMPHEAISLYSSMFCTISSSVSHQKCDAYTYSSVLKACAETKQILVGKALHCHILRSHVNPSRIVYNSLLNMYVACLLSEVPLLGCDMAARLFKTMRKRNVVSWNTMISCEMQERDVVSWNSMIFALVQNGLDDEGLMLVYEMQKQGFSIDDVTITALLSAASNLRDQEIGKQTHAYLIRHCVQFSGMGSYLIDMYAKSGLTQAAETIFSSNCKGNHDRAIWNAMISGSMQNGLIGQSFVIFQQMLEENVIPNAVTLVSILPACSQSGNIGLGKLLHGFAIRNFMEQNVFVSSSMVDMYSKSGAIVYAERVFMTTTGKNSVTCTNMIQGYGQHGMVEKAFMLFYSMKELGIDPDAVTFVAVLSACSYAGLIDEGVEIFELMESEYGIRPSTEHYACIMDMLGRVGRVVEAYDFVQRLGKEGNVSGIWGSLLAACKIHKNFELGKSVANKLLEIEGAGRITGYHVLLSNIHAEEGNWEDVKSLRQEMLQKGLTKEVGCSWIDASGYVNCFTSKDRRHPQCAEIYQLLKVLSDNMKDAGDAPPLLSSEFVYL